MEKNRSITEQRLINAVYDIITEEGFEKLGVNAVAAKAGVDKKLIYRYFQSLDGLIYECLKRNDFWANIPIETVQSDDLNRYLKEMFRTQIAQLRDNDILKQVYCWELSKENKFIAEIRKKREEAGLQLIDMVGKITQNVPKELVAIATLISGGITYFVMLEETCQQYNGINIQSDEGWEQLATGIDKIIDLIYSTNDN